MRMHINTALIIEEFKKDCECPVCSIKREVENVLVEQFLNEAVMVDEYRKMVNEKGFCLRHYQNMLSRQSKLGVALQNVTRLRSLTKLVKPVKKEKEAIKQAEIIKNAISSCIICEIAEENMQRYYRTIAEMYSSDNDFKAHFTKTKGFCLVHYSQLLKNAKYAKSVSEEFLKDLTALEQENLGRITEELQWFCDKHDYRNREASWGTSKDSPLRSAEKIHGKND